MAIETFDCWEQALLWSTFTDTTSTRITESAVVHSSATLVASGTASEVATIHSSLISTFHYALWLASEQVNVSSAALPGWITTATENFLVSSLARQEIEAVVTELVQLDDSTSIRTRSSNIVTESFAVKGLLPSNNNGATASETFLIHSAVADNKNLSSLATESFLIHAAVVQAGRARDTAEEEAKLATSITAHLHGVNVAREQFYVGDFLSNPLHTAWLVDIRQLGMTRYTDLKSQFVIGINGSVVGLADTGVYKHDPAVEVQASVTTGKLELGSEQKKRLEPVYAYGESASPLQLTVAYDAQGTELSRDYPFMNRLTDNTRTTRCKVGKGMSSRYYQFTVSNPDGAHFALRKLSVDVGVTARRI